MATLSAVSLPGLPEIARGDDLAALIAAAAEGAGESLSDATVIAVAHKAVSKAEGAVIALSGVTPGDRARGLAASHGKDARVMQVVLDESAEILRAERGVLICRTHHGFVCANAGVDHSNVTAPDTLVLLPRDPDASARRLRARVNALTGTRPAVLVSDSFGRAWRHGQCDVALGCAGLAPLQDWRGHRDGAGRELHATWLAVADAAAAAADLARAKDSREPVVLIRGLARHITADDGPGAAALLRPLNEDLFR
jgi:coenzyme F420-0:L-glutamate ligase/coenzyme F420-1:gamma-L-glutamate ligase